MVFRYRLSAGLSNGISKICAILLINLYAIFTRLTFYIMYINICDAEYIRCRNIYGRSIGMDIFLVVLVSRKVFCISLINRSLFRDDEQWPLLFGLYFIYKYKYHLSERFKLFLKNEHIYIENIKI